MEIVSSTRLFFLVMVLATLIGLAPTVFANEPQRAGKENLVTMNFDNADISVVARFISAITGKNFVIDESVRGKVSIIAPARVTPAQAFCIFQSALQLKGFATVGAGPVIKIVPSRDARSFAPVTESRTPAGVCAESEAGATQY
jgi:general secretion pathway protein D